MKDQLHKAFVGGVRPKAVHVVHGQVQPVQRPLTMPIAPIVSAGSRLHRDDRDETGLNLESEILNLLIQYGPKLTIFKYNLWGGGTKARNILVATRRSPKQWTQKSSDFFKF